MGEVVIHSPAHLPQYLNDQCSGSDSIDVVITKDDHLLLFGSSFQKAVHSYLHVRQLKRVGKILELGPEKMLYLVIFTEASVEQALEQKGREIKGFG